MKLKNPGISLFISLGISFTVLSIAMAIMVSISRSLRQSTTIERSNQVFFAAESGIESAFFHHNARGQGTHFVTTPVPDSQKISHPGSSAEVEWSIDGRTSGTALNPDPIIGLLQEGERVQVKFYADSATNPSQAPSITTYFPNDFELTFYEEITDSEGDIGEEALYEKYGAIDISGFDFDADSDDTLIDWNFSGQRKSEDLFDTLRVEDKRESLTSSSLENEDKCDGSFLCVGNIFGFGPTFDTSLEGRIFPYEGGSELRESIQTFVSEHDNVTFAFQPLQRFESGGTKIPGIPFAILTGTTPVPRDKYTVTANVSIGDFYKTISLDVKESASIGAFDYVIFD